MKKKRLLCGLLAAVVFCTAGIRMQLPSSVPALHAEAADGRLYNQWDEKWKDVTYTKYSYAGNSLYVSACGIFSFCNAIYALNSHVIDMVEISNWAVDIGALRPGAGGTYRDILYANVEEKWGEAYGFTIAGTYAGTVFDERFIEHLKNGGVAVLHVPGHFIAVTGYDELYHTYQVIESAVSNGRGLQPVGWVPGEKLTEGNTNGMWYALISNIKKPEYAKLTLPRSFYATGEPVLFTLDSNTRNQYQMDFFSTDDSLITSVNVNDSARSSLQHFGCSFSYAGDYYCKAKSTNAYGSAESNKLSFSVYDKKPDSAQISLLTKDPEAGKPVEFEIEGSPAVGYEVQIQDETGAPVWDHSEEDVLDGKQKNSARTTWTPEHPGIYQCRVKLENYLGDLESDPVTFKVLGNVNVSFDAVGGNVAEAMRSIPYEGNFGSLPVPERDNHRFDGWFTAPDGGTAVTPDTEMKQTQPHSVYAHWTKILERGDINGNHKIDLVDARKSLSAYTYLFVGEASGLDSAEEKACDIDRDGKITLKDTRYILQYYVYNSVVKDPVTWDELMFRPKQTTAAATVTTTGTTTATTKTTAKTTAAAKVTTTAKTTAAAGTTTAAKTTTAAQTTTAAAVTTPAPFSKFSDYSAWAENTGYPDGLLTAQGKDGINEDAFRSQKDSGAYQSGTIVIGDSRCCQLGIREQRCGTSDFAVFAVWGGHYAGSGTILTEEAAAQIRSCALAQLQEKGASRIFLFATVNDYDYNGKLNAGHISAVIKAAEQLQGIICTVGGKTLTPQITIVGIDGGRTDGTVLGVQPQAFNSAVESYNTALSRAVADSNTLRNAAFVTVSELTGTQAAFIDDGLHYDDATLDAIRAAIAASSGD